MRDIFIEYNLYFDWFFVAGWIILSVYVAYKIMRRIIENDYTFKEIKAIDNGVTISEALEISIRKDKKPFYEKFTIITDMYEKTAERLLLVDEVRVSVIYFMLFLKYIFPVILTLITLLTSPERLMTLVIVIFLLEAFPEMLIRKSIKDHEKKFEAHAYKLFKYINNQKSAGVTTHKIITKLHKVVEDQKLKNRLISFAAEYVTHNDYDEAINANIIKFYNTADALALDSALRLGLEIGDAQTDSEGYERLMFNKYMNTVDYETEKKKMHTVFSALMFALPTILLVGYILYVDIGTGLATIFSK